MQLTLGILINIFITILYFLLPAYCANGAALAFGGGTPLDFGKSSKNGVRWIGDGVTWRGLIAGTIIGIIVGALQGLVGPYLIANIGEYIYTPIITNLPQGILTGFLLGFGALLGDALGSFIKRRIGIGRGKPAPILDQLDFVVVALLLASFVINYNTQFTVASFIAVSILLTLVIHLLANTGAYLLGLKDVWY